jgi:tetratricopeptide (TPR) repeat protein
MLHEENLSPTYSRCLPLFAILAGLAALIAVTLTINDIGITTDEPHYYESCLQEIAWFREAIGDISRGEWREPFKPEVLDRHWNFELLYNVHPPFYKLCSSLTLVLFERWLGPMGAYRLSPAIMFSILVGVLFFAVGRRYGLWSGLWAAAGLALMPRIFSDAHFGATDMPITVLWVFSAMSFHRALKSRRWALLFALVYGLALSTKFTAFVIPLPLVAYVILSRRFKESVWPVGIALVLSPLIMITLNPQWWHDTFGRVYLYILNSSTRFQYLQIPTYYLGKKYSFYLPWHHPLIFTLFTVSPVVLAAFLYGSWRTVRRPFSDQWASHMLLHWLAVIGVMMLPSSPGHDGVRLFLPSFPFLAIISARGFHDFISQALPRFLARLYPGALKAVSALAPLILAVMVIPAAISLVTIHPYELCYYNSLAGGISGANKLGMESTYWYDPINDKACRLINETIPDSAGVVTSNNWHYTFLQRLGRIKPSLRFRREQFSYILQYCRQGVFSDQDWVLYRRGSPRMEIKIEGVRLLALFKIPDDLRQILVELRRTKSPESLYETAIVYQMLSQPDSAFLCLNRYLELKPKDFKASMFLVSYYLKNDLPDRAVERLNLMAENPEDPIIWHFNMGAAYYQMGKNEEAIGSFRECLKYKRLDYSALKALAMTYDRLGRLEEESEQYELIMRTEPYDLNALYMLGKINQRWENKDRAKYFYTRLLEESPDHLETLVNMGVLEHSEGKTEKAEEYFKRALRQDSTYVPACFNLACLFAETGRLNLAESRFQAILKSNPGDSQTHLALALLYQKDLSRGKEALEHFRILSQLLPEQAIFIEKEYILPLQEKLSRSARKP